MYHKAALKASFFWSLLNRLHPQLPPGGREHRGRRDVLVPRGQVVLSSPTGEAGGESPFHGDRGFVLYRRRTTLRLPEGGKAPQGPPSGFPSCGREHRGRAAGTAPLQGAGFSRKALCSRVWEQPRASRMEAGRYLSPEKSEFSSSIGEAEGSCPGMGVERLMARPAGRAPVCDIVCSGIFIHAVQKRSGYTRSGPLPARVPGRPAHCVRRHRSAG